MKDLTLGPYEIPFLPEFGATEWSGRLYSHGSFNKMIPFVLPPGHHCAGDGYTLAIDSDVLMTRPIPQDFLGGDIVVWPEKPSSQIIREVYYDLDRLLVQDPDFRYPGYNFNAGQLLGRPGALTPFADRISSPETIDLTMFFRWEQGMLNYVVQKLHQEGSLDVRFAAYAIFSMDLEKAASGEGVLPPLVHYCTQPRMPDAFTLPGPLRDEYMTAPPSVRLRTLLYVTRHRLGKYMRWFQDAAKARLRTCSRRAD